MAQVVSQMIDQPIAGAIPASHTSARCAIRGPGEDAGMGPQDSFAELDQRLREGDQGAATEVFRRFAGRLIAVARTELYARLRRKEDPEDVVQSVYRSFFARHRAGQFDLVSWRSLWGLLTVITVRKCLGRVRHYLAQRRNLAGESGVAYWVDATDDLESLAIDREPTPLEAAILVDTVEQMMRGLEPDDRAIIELSLQGYTVREIGERLGRSERTVRRVRERIEKRLHRMQADETCAT
jgi:RNA polymerase sigma-70 factor, ECF subfamily